MTMEWYDEPDETDGDDMASGWGIPLNEPLPTSPPTEPPTDTDEPAATLLLRPFDDEPGAEFHPHLRRFGEAS